MIDPNLHQILLHAQENMNRQLRKLQEQLLLKERFGLDAVLSPDHYRAGNNKHVKDLYENLQTEYEELLALASRLEKFLSQVDEISFEKGLADLLSQLSKKK